MTTSPFRRGWLATASLAAAAASALVLPAVTANAAPVTASATAPVSPDAATVHADILSGTAQAKYGVDKMCASHGLRCGVQVLTTSTGSAHPLVTSGPSGYGPKDFDAAYHPDGTGTGTIAILDAGAYPNLEQDLAAYRKQYGLPECSTANGCLSIKGYDGGAAQTPQTSTQGKQIEEEVGEETALDVEAASAACPDCKIAEYQLPYLDATNSDEAKSMQDFGTAVDSAVADGAKAISISYGFDGNADSLTGATAKKFDRTGVAIAASSGDSGFIAGQHSSWPASLPTVTAVGGTKLSKQTDGSYTETVWNEQASQHGAAGSGCESSVDPAVGQPKEVSDNCNGHRADTDVSADADPVTGFSVYDTYTPASGSGGGWLTVGGTSASSPLIAGYYVRSGKTDDVHGPNTLYAAPASSFNDVTSGNNEYNGTCAANGTAQKVCTAGPGWDGPTGLGTPNGLGAF